MIETWEQNAKLVLSEIKELKEELKCLRAEVMAEAKISASERGHRKAVAGLMGTLGGFMIVLADHLFQFMRR